MERPVIVGLGELLWDLFPTGKKMGGAPANFAYHAGALGAEAFVVTCVGKDELGKEILESLGKHGLDLRYVETTSLYPTGKVSIELDKKGKPNFTIHENAAWDHISCSPDILALAGRADAVCFGSLAQRSPVSRDTIRRFLLHTDPDECLRVFDINLRQSYYSEEVIRESLGMCRMLKLNDEELPVVCRILGIEGAESDTLETLAEQFDLRAVALTKGDKGSTILTNQGMATHPGFKPERIADTVGAGDAFTASLVMGLLRGDDPDTICRNANRLAGYVCSREGAMPPIPAYLKTKNKDT